MTAWLSILGIGEDGLAGMTPPAAALLRDAELVVGGARHLALAEAAIRGETLSWSGPPDDAIDAVLRRSGRPVAVLASGDPFCFGIGATLARRVPAAQCRSIPVASAAALARNRLGWSEEEAALRSVCGRPVAALAAGLCPGQRLVVLCADERSPAAIAALLRGRGYGDSILHVMEALGGPRERVRTLRAADAAPEDIARLNLVAIETVAGGPGTRRVSLSPGLPDEWFEHDGQLTRREIRAATLSALRPEPGLLLWDLGAGSGSVGIEWMLRDGRCRAVAVERDPERAERIERNAAALGVPDLSVRRGEIECLLPDLPAPDAVFVGGGASRPGLLDILCDRLPPHGVMVVNAVSAEGEAALLSARLRRGGTLRRFGLERLAPIGAMHAFRPAMTVTQWVLDRWYDGA